MTEAVGGISNDILALGRQAEGEVSHLFGEIDDISFENSARVLAAFSRHRVSETCFAGTTGYGYDDVGRDTLEKIYADVFGAEAALVRIGFVNGTHAITAAMFSALKHGDTLLSATGEVYDTLRTLVGRGRKTPGTFSDYGIGFRMVPLKNKAPDLPAIRAACKNKSVKAVFVQRSKGYSERQSLSCEMIGRIVEAVRDTNPTAAVIVDNCYGEFVEKTEPTHSGADLVAGSLIKNPGGGLALTGGYLAGRRDLIEAAAARLTVPGIGAECGSSLYQNRRLYQGLFMAPHTVAQALKTAVFCAALMKRLGYEVSPQASEPRYDIIQSIRFGAPEPLLRFARGIQQGSPVDSFVTPEPWAMPGYDCEVVMAAGTFVQGSSIELSCDAPMKEPYVAYLQGGLTYESGKFGVLLAAERLLSK